jgi:hypothetical protein
MSEDPHSQEAFFRDMHEGLRKAWAERDALEQALKDYGDHQSRRCEYPPHYYLAGDPPTDDCPCGFDKTMRELGLHPDQQGDR